MPADRPILLKNARLIDPAGDREERGGVLVRDGVIQAVGPQVVQAADAQVIDCGGQVLSPGLIDMRAFIGEPGGALSRDAQERRRGGCGGRRHDRGLHARHEPGSRRSGRHRLHRAPRPRHLHRQHLPGRRPDQGTGRAGDGGDRPPQGGRRHRVHRWRALGDECAGHAPRSDLRPRLRRADRPPCGGSRPRRPGRDERGRVRLAARAAGHSARGRDGDAGARHPPRAPHRRTLPRRHDLRPPIRRRSCAPRRKKGCRSPAACPSTTCRSTRTTSAITAPS